MKYHEFLYSLFFGVLIALASCQPQKQSSIDMKELNDIYQELRTGYGEGDTLRAEKLVARMLPCRYPEEQRKRYVHFINSGLLQWMYTYFYAESSASGFQRFQRMANGEDSTLDLPKECQRKLLILSAYLGMQCGDITQAIACLERGLKLSDYPTADERYADYTFAGSVYSQAEGKVNQSIEMYKKALVELEKSTDQSGLPWVLSNLAELYELNGRFEDAIHMYYQSLEYFKPTGNDEGIASVYYSLTQLCRHLDMWEEAKDYADEGLIHAHRSGHTYTIGILLLEKYELAAARKQNDTARHNLLSADSCFIASNSPVEHLSTQAALAQLSLQDSAQLDEVIRRMEEIQADTLINQSPHALTISAELAINYLKQGQTAKALQMIDTVLPKLETDKREVILQRVYQNLAAHFRSLKDYQHESAWLNKEIKLREELFEDAKMRHVAAYRIQYETSRKELENERLKQDMQLKQRTLVYTWSIAGLLIALLVYTGIYYRQRQMYHRKQSELRLSQISALLNSQSKLQLDNKHLKEELTQQQESEPEDKAASPLNLVQRILDQNEEMNFRRSFVERFPYYLPTLRNRCPDLTRMDELIAMLLLLDQSNDEIALALNITKGSVNKARSRMRKRLGLVDTGIVLEEYLKGITKAL